MPYSQSHLLREDDDHSSSSSSRRRMRRENSQLTVATPPAPAPGSSSGDISPTTRRWQATFRAIRHDRQLLNQFLRRLLSRPNFFGPFFVMRLEDTVRRVLREELRPLFTYLNSPPRLLPDQNFPARYRLYLRCNVDCPIFTTKTVNPIPVVMFDTFTQNVASPGCFLSSAKIKITVLDAEFWKDKGETWSTSEFNESVLSNRDGKEPILTGDLTLHLENGRGTFGNIIFRDNSSWTKSGFRLGVMVVVEGGEKRERVQEGLSNPFVVRDRRGEGKEQFEF